MKTNLGRSGLSAWRLDVHPGLSPNTDDLIMPPLDDVIGKQTEDIPYEVAFPTWLNSGKRYSIQALVFAVPTFIIDPRKVIFCHNTFKLLYITVVACVALTFPVKDRAQFDKQDCIYYRLCAAAVHCTVCVWLMCERV